ncbi:hypothetical protein A2Y85_03880 [candidate division WOR-3 bacterium RBG_13_43_14]|uniref:DNA 3'-5' helicase n=1 Tax=candidate division WOR-3 bacterium RBG_13_43_14 TaxID=1802590 RepID=A0A1F4UAY7_UNCW3|nr:MAG: hypothetical protein A2Y85_03880 [candidate division WOR-3 bacterium RBG_13_43_14]
MLQKKFGKYELISWCGGGAFGDVFLARDTILDKLFALKIARMHKDDINMLRDEARLLASLDHPNIVRFYNIDFIENKFVMVIEYVEGNTLRDIINADGMDCNDVLTILMQMLDGLSYAHDKKVLHRDLKPENVLITDYQGKKTVKIADFGLARFIRSGTISASTAGTPLYMSPETWSGNFTEKSDIWSLGILLYEMIAGIPPFLDDALSRLQIKIANGSFLLPSMIRSNVPEIIEETIARMLCVDSRARSTAQELLAYLKQRHKAVVVTSTLPTINHKIDEIKLTADQKEIIDHTGMPILVLGQAGCGKTSTLTFALKKLLDQGKIASRILVCTFTNKAANDIKMRLQKITSYPLHELWLGTFHALGLNILRRDAERLDIDENFTVVVPVDEFNRTGIKTGKYRSRAVLKQIELFKSQGMQVQDIKPQSKWEAFCQEAYSTYQTHLKTNNYLDYNDLIFFPLRLLNYETDLRDHYQQSFDYIFVDELQDINPAQYRLISLLIRDNFFFTGDIDQAIYGWRGADRDLIYQVPKDFPKVKIFQLSRSFRLPQQIVDLANNLMLRKPTTIPNSDNADIVLYAASSEEEEAEYIIKEIKALKHDHYRFQDFAILYRMNSLSRLYEEKLMKERIPHALIGGASFFERLDIKPVIEYLELLDYYINKKPITTEYRLEFIARALTLFNISKKNEDKAREILAHQISEGRLLKPLNIVNECINTFGLKGENINELQALARSHDQPGLSNFMSEIRLVQELDLVDWGKDTVKLMTIHSAKGLEFPVVFMVDMVEEIFPLTKKLSAQKELEEERRICYVGLTRAQKKLYLLYPKWRYGRSQKPSRFLIDMFKQT